MTENEAWLWAGWLLSWAIILYLTARDRRLTHENFQLRMELDRIRCLGAFFVDHADCDWPVKVNYESDKRP